MPFCCVIQASDPGAWCSQTFDDDYCWEHPSDGVLTACDIVTGTGCDDDRPICCAMLGHAEHYCTSHAYLGDVWACTIAEPPVTMGSE
jgi:hypothetical protein